MIDGQPVCGQTVAAGALRQRPCHPADGGHTDRGVLVDFPIRHTAQQPGHHPPSIAKRLKLGRGAQVAEKRAHLGRVIQHGQGPSQTGFELGAGRVGGETAAFHEVRQQGAWRCE